MKWERNPVLDSMEAEGRKGEYYLIRTFRDSNKLYLGNQLLRTDFGAHRRNVDFAEDFDKIGEKS